MNVVADSSPRFIHIDGTDAATEGTFVSSVTGANLTYFNWPHNEPNNWNNEDCLSTISDNGFMNDVKCSEPLPSVCERRELKKRNRLCSNISDEVRFFIYIIALFRSND